MGDWYLGEIRNFASASTTPPGWTPCDGRSLPVNQNMALYSLIGNTYGGTPQSTFNLPDLRGRVVVGVGQAASGTTYLEGKAGGAETQALTLSQMPAHNHTFNCRVEPGTTGAVAGNTIATAGTNAAVPTQQPLYAAPGASPVPLNPASIATVGGSAPHANMQPFQVTNFYIATAGIYPTRS